MKSNIKIGDTFGLWTVRDFSNAKKWSVVCQCDCGNVRDVLKSSLNNGTSKSCGCVAARKLSISARTHGMSNRKDPTYNAWCSMKARCVNLKHPGYQLYGGRGIKVCNEWLGNYMAFRRDMGDRPDGYTLERKNTNGDYEKTNCHWVSHKKNCQNRRQSKTWYVKGLRFDSANDAAEHFGVVLATIMAWCNGYKVAGVSYPRKPGCYSIAKYENKVIPRAGYDEASLRRAVEQVLEFA